LIVLLAIVGIVAAVAIPSYGDYAHRAQASEAVSLLGGAKTPLARYKSSVDTVAAVPLPACDPVFGPKGPLFNHWNKL